MNYFLQVLFLSLFLTSNLVGADSKNENKIKPGGFDQALIALADAVLDPIPGFPPMVAPDPGFSEKELLGWDDERIRKFSEDAEDFFRKRWGFDFSNIEADENGVKVLPGVGIMLHVKFVTDFKYRISHMSGRRVDRRLDTMGFMVMVTEPGALYHGEIGGSEGVKAFPGETISFGVYHIAKEKINAKKHKKLKYKKKHSDDKDIGDVIFFKRNSPARITENGHIGIYCDLESEKWGKGIGEGVAGASLLPNGKFQAYSKVMMTFPGRVYDSPINNQTGGSL